MTEPIWQPNIKETAAFPDKKVAAQVLDMMCGILWINSDYGSAIKVNQWILEILNLLSSINEQELRLMLPTLSSPAIFQIVHLDLDDPLKYSLVANLVYLYLPLLIQYGWVCHKVSNNHDLYGIAVSATEEFTGEKLQGVTDFYDSTLSILQPLGMWDENKRKFICAEVVPYLEMKHFQMYRVEDIVYSLSLLGVEEGMVCDYILPQLLAEGYLTAKGSTYGGNQFRIGYERNLLEGDSK